MKLTKSRNKKVEFLGKLLPNMKQQDLEVMSDITSDKEIKEYCKELGWDKKELNAIKL